MNTLRLYYPTAYTSYFDSCPITHPFSGKGDTLTK